jgi:hypothetical protein
MVQVNCCGYVLHGVYCLLLLVCVAQLRVKKFIKKNVYRRVCWVLRCDCVCTAVFSGLIAFHDCKITHQANEQARLKDNDKLSGADNTLM